MGRVERIVEILDTAGYKDHAHFLRGQSLLVRNRVNPALNELNQINPDNREIRFQAAVAFGLGLLARNQPQKAEQLLLYVVSEDPEHVDAHRGLATIYFDQGAKALAVQHARLWARLAPDDGHAHWMLGTIYADYGDSNAWAIASFREALSRKLSPKVVDKVREELAEVLVKQTDYAQALQVVDEFSPERRERQKAFEIRVECLWNLSAHEELRSLMERALSNFPHSLSLLRLRGQMYLTDDNPKGAVSVLKRALEIDRYDTGSRYLLAQAYETLGQRSLATEQQQLMEQARERFSEMSKLSDEAITQPWNGAVRLRLAEVCDKFERHDEAAMWRKAAAACQTNVPSGAAVNP
jgi:Tfp pilus assembly protein PilF